MQSILFLSGSLLLVYGAFLGFPYWLSLNKGQSNAQTWRMAHSAITAGAVSMMAIAAGFHLLQLPRFGAIILVAGATISGYGFAAASTLAATTGHRGLNGSGHGGSRVVLFFNVLGALGSVIAGPFLLYGACSNIFRR